VRVSSAQVSVGHYYGVSCRSVRIDAGGGNAVMLFFVMSGFVMGVAYGDRARALGRQADAGVHLLKATSYGETDTIVNGKGGAVSRLSLNSFTLRFLARRAARIGPLYWLSLLLYLPYSFYEQCRLPHLDLADPTSFALPMCTADEIDLIALTTLTTALFVTAWIPYPYGASINTPLWTVTCQFSYWALFPRLALWLPDRLSLRRTLFACALLGLLYAASSVAVAAVVFAADYQPETNMFARKPPPIMYAYLVAHLWPLAKMPIFLIGQLCGAAAMQLSDEAQAREQSRTQSDAPSDTPSPVDDTRKQPDEQRWWPRVAGLVTLFYLSFTAMQVYVSSVPALGKRYMLVMRIGSELAFPPLFGLWLLALSQSADSRLGRLLSCRPLKTAGAISFAWYVLHMPLLSYYGWLRLGFTPYWAARADRSLPLLSAVEILPFFALLAVLSIAAHYLIEVPARRELSRKLDLMS